MILRPLTFLFFALAIFISGCAGTGGFKEAKYKDDSGKDINILGMLDKEFASKNFGGFRFVFENTRDQWLTLENVKLSFTDDSAKKYIRALDPQGLNLWGKAILQQQHIKGSDFNQLQSALIKAGSSFTGIVIDEGGLANMTSGDGKMNYPENHLYADQFILPPNFAVEKWILFESSHHNNIPYVTNVQLDFDINSKHQSTDLQFREKSKRYNNFIWFDPTRKKFLDFYMGVNLGSAFPIGEFSESANPNDNIVNSFGLSAYVTLVTNLGINFSLDYQTFQARAKLPVDADSLLLLNKNFEFSSWQNFELLVSPRFVFPLNTKFDLFAELAVGLVMSKSPTIVAKRAGLEIDELEGKNSVSLAGGFAIGARLYLSTKLCLDLKTEFIPFLNPKFTYQTLDNQETELSQDMSHFKIKATLNWDL